MTLTADLARRYGRQIQLSEIGDAGQAKLCAAEVGLVTTGFARLIEDRYARAAGLNVVSKDAPLGAPASSVKTLELGLRHAAAREVAEGAMAALDAIRAVVLPR